MATTYTITPNPVSVNEGASTQTFTITRSGTLLAETIYASTTQSEGYTNSNDYTGILNKSLSFTLNQVSQTVTIAITNDTVVEPNETFGLIVQRNTSDPVSTYLAKTSFTIADDDTKSSTLAIVATNADKAEGDSGITPFTFTVNRSGSLNQVSTVNWDTYVGTASYAAGDYTDPVTISIYTTFPKNCCAVAFKASNST